MITQENMFSLWQPGFTTFFQNFSFSPNICRQIWESAGERKQSRDDSGNPPESWHPC